MLGINDLHISHFLTDFSVGYTPPEIIGEALFPIISVDKQNNNYPVWGRDNFRAPETARAPATPSRKVVFSVSSDKYVCINHGLQTEIPLEFSGNAISLTMLQQGGVRTIRGNMSQAHEKRVINTVTSTSNVGSSMTKTTSTTLQWNDFINSDPVNDIEIAKESIRSVTGAEANIAVISQKTFIQLKQHPQILAMAFPHGAGGGTARREDLERIFDIEKVLIGKSIENTAKESATFDAFTGSDMWGRNVFVGRVEAEPDLFSQTYGKTFLWTPEGLPAPMTVMQQRFNDVGGEYVDKLEIQSFQDEKVTATKLGFLIVDAVAA